MDNLYARDDTDEEKTRSTPKVPFRILKTPIDRIKDFAIPYHLERLKAHSELIKEYQARREWSLLVEEQVEASNAVKLLKSDLYELRQISHSVKEEDVPLFQKTIEEPTDDVISAIATFLEENSNALRPVPKLDFDVPSSSEPGIPALVCNLDEPAAEEEQFFGTSQTQADENLLEAPLKVQTHWAKLTSELYELNELFKKFSSLIFTQKDSVNRIEDNVQNARDNVHEGTKHLNKAVILQAATFPAAGAAIGGLVFGPIGAIAGFKLFGTVACALSGSVLGLGAGMKLKKKRQALCEMEMKAITCSTKAQSLSTPNLLESSKD